MATNHLHCYRFISTNYGQMICNFATNIYWKVQIYLKVNSCITYHAHAIQCLGHEHELHQTNKETQNQNELITTPIKTTSVFLSEKFVLQENVFLVIFAISSTRCEEFSAPWKVNFYNLACIYNCKFYLLRFRFP